MFVIGLGFNFAFNVVPFITSELSSEYDLNKFEETIWNDRISGLFLFFFESGGFILPSVAGILLDRTGSFEMMMLYLSLFPLILILMIGLE